MRRSGWRRMRGRRRSRTCTGGDAREVVEEGVRSTDLASVAFVSSGTGSLTSSH